MLATLCSRGREQKQGPAFPYSTDLALVRTERFNRLAIPVVSVNHTYSSRIDTDCKKYPGSLHVNQGSNLTISSRSYQTLAQCLPHRQLVEYSLHDRMDWDNAKRTTRLQQALNW